MTSAVANTHLQELLEFVKARVPSALEEYPPVTRTQTDELLAACSPRVVAALPRAARDVISWLGGSDSKTISIFGAMFTTSIILMLEDLEFQVLADRFFRVAIDRNPEQMTQDDLYIDLTRSNGEDAPLIVLGEEWCGEQTAARGHTILSMAISRVFHDFELAKRGFRGYLAEGYLPEESDTRWEDYSIKMASVAERMDLQELFALRPDLRCYSTPDVAMMFNAMGGDLRTPDGYIQIWIGAENRDAFLNYAAQIRSAMPPLPILDEWRRLHPGGSLI